MPPHNPREPSFPEEPSKRTHHPPSHEARPSPTTYGIRWGGNAALVTWLLVVVLTAALFLFLVLGAILGFWGRFTDGLDVPDNTGPTSTLVHRGLLARSPGSKP